MTAVHEPDFGVFLRTAEKAAEEQTSVSPISLIAAQREIHSNENIRQSMDYDHGVFQIRDGVLPNAGEELLKILSAWKVQPHELDQKCAESLNSNSM